MTRKKEIQQKETLFLIDESLYQQGKELKKLIEEHNNAIQLLFSRCSDKGINQYDLKSRIIRYE